jgi:uncharacterized protein
MGVVRKGAKMETSSIGTGSPDQSDHQAKRRSAASQFRKLAFLLACLYIGIGAVVLSPLYSEMALRPTSLQSFGDFEKLDHILNAKRQEVFIEAVDGQKMHGWFFKNPDAQKVIVMSHGNAGNILNRLFHAKSFIECGTSVLLFDYRGYGKSGGVASLGGIVEDGLSTYDFVVEKLGYKPDDIIWYGESIGTGVACCVSSKKPVHALILQSPVGTLPEVAMTHFQILRAYPEVVFPRPHFNNIEEIHNTHVPLLIMHGKVDRLVPYRHSQLIFDQAHKPKQLHFFNGAGHNDVVDAPEYKRVLHEFITSVP